MRLPPHPLSEEGKERLSRRTYTFLRKSLPKDEAEKIWLAGQTITDLDQRTLFYSKVIVDVQRAVHLKEAPEALNDFSVYKWEPVSFEEFVCSDYYLNKKAEIYPLLLRELIEINSGKYVEAVFTGGIGSGKALALDTPIPTPTGWTRMGDLKDGDVVFDENGQPTKVLQAHPILLQQSCYRVHFSDGSSMVACGDHQWRTWTSSQRGNRTSPSILSTTQILDTLHKRHAIEVCRPIVCPDSPRLGIDPYTLGVWLGDGSSDSATFWTADEEVLDEIGRYYPLTRQRRPAGCMEPHTVHGVSKTLGRYGLFKNKHIPLVFKRASKYQRLSLLQGLMDSDGTVDKKTGRVSFTNTNERLARDVYELVCSLGWKPSCRERDARLNGAFVSKCWVVAWSPNGEEAVFRLSRKAKYQGSLSLSRATSHASWRMIERVEEVPSVPVRCITVDSYSRLYLAGESFIPTHNTTGALYTNAYQLYLLSCMRSPHRQFGLDSASEILLIFQSMNEKLAKGVDFNRFKSMIEGCKYFHEKFPFDKNVESKLVFPNRIEVHPVSGLETAAIGQNVIGGLIDELNYMSVVQKSKQSVDQGTYDQAIALYNSISRRRKSRFMVNGKLPGILCLVSSKRYPGQFTDQKEEEAKTDPTIYIYDRRVWDIKPDAFAKSEWFKVFTGDLTRKPRILTPGEEVAEDDAALVMDIPMDYFGEFDKDIINSLREIAGVSTLARHPFFMETTKVAEVFVKRPSVFSSPRVDFVASKLTLLKGAFYKPELPRFVHCDLARTGDSAGLALGCVTGFTNMKELGRGQEEGYLPNIHIDGILEVKPPKNSEIQFYKIREVLLALRKMGLNVRWVTFDTFQSADSMQLLRQQGFVTGTQSMDIVPCKPYDFLKNAVYDGRVSAPLQAHTHKEMLTLEKDVKTMKVDHPPNGSKDTVDALAGVVYGLTMRREIWGMFDIPLLMIPDSVMHSSKLEAENNKGQATQAAMG